MVSVNTAADLHNTSIYDQLKSFVSKSQANNSLALCVHFWKYDREPMLETLGQYLGSTPSLGPTPIRASHA